MSAYLAIAEGDSVALWTDGATLADDGTVAEIRSKVWASKHVPLAVTGRGNVALIAGLAGGILAMSECGSVDRTLAGLADSLAKQAATDAPFTEIVVAAISETRGPLVFMILTQAANGFPALALIDCDGAAYGGPPVELAGDGLAIFQAARGTPAADRDGMLQFAVGGFVERTAITGDGVTTRRLHTWPEDEVGKTIAPND